MILFNWMNFILARSFHEIGIDACRVERQTQCELLCARAHLFSFHTHLITFVILLLSEYRANVVAWCNSTFRLDEKPQTAYQ